MDLLRYEFIEGPDDSINGMIRTLVKGLRYNRSYVTIEEFKEAMPNFHRLESKLQQLDSDLLQPKRNYIQEIMEELEKEQEDEDNIEDELKRATIATIREVFGREFQFDELSFTSTDKADHYHIVQLNGYKDSRGVDADLIVVKEVFRAISYKYNYIFIDFS